MVAFIIVIMENKIERLASELIKKYPNATLREAFVAGYFRSTEAWIKRER